MKAATRIFDSHFHIIDGRFPLTPNNGYLPPDFTCTDYLERMSGTELIGGAVVSGSFQAFDQSYLLDALAVLGPRFVGVTQLPASATDEEIISLHAAGVRAVRFNIRRGGSEDVSRIGEMARRVHDLAGWHVELYADAGELAGLRETLLRLPSVSIDHLGLSMAGLDLLVDLAGRGVRVKATGFGRVDFNVAEALKALFAANPDALMFGTDLPSTRAPRPYCDEDMALITETFDEAAAAKILYANAVDFYGVTR